MAVSPASWQPNWAVAPGEILLEALEERDMSQAELARRMDRPAKTINEIVKGKAAITSETAIQLERALGISANFWNGLESKYRAHLARERATSELAGNVQWVDRFPVKDLVKNGLIKASSSKIDTMEELLRFFRVSSPTAWKLQWEGPQASFRASPAYVSNPEAVASWLQWGEIEGRKIDCSPWSPEDFRNTLQEVRELTRVDPVSFALNEVVSLCRRVGVAVVLTPELRGTRLSGAARWLSSDKALIQLSLRHGWDDQIWFTFMHEAGHLLSPGRKSDHVDSHDPDEIDGESENKEEKDADEFARNFLIPPDKYESFVSERQFGAEKVKIFARSIGVATGIVVGRLQYDKYINFSELNALKRKVRFQ